MADALSIVEFRAVLAYPGTDTSQIAATPAVAYQSIAISSSASVACAPFTVDTNIIRVQSSTACYLVFGPIGTSIATATATGLPLSGGVAEYFGVNVNGVALVNATTQVLAVISAF